MIIQSPQARFSNKKIPPLFLSGNINGGESNEKTHTPTEHKQWAMRDSNPHSMDYESTALTVKLIALTFLIDITHTPMCKFQTINQEFYMRRM